MPENTSRVFTFTRPIGTSKKRVSLVANARDTLRGAGFGKMTEVDVATGGQFSIIDAIEAVLEYTGPADVTLATWTAAQFDLTQIEKQLRSGNITSLRLIIDRSFVSRQPGFTKRIVEHFGDGAVRTTRTHAKFAVIRNADWSVVIRTSMNLNFNSRLEYLQVAEDAELADFWLNVADAIFDETIPGVDGPRSAPELAGVSPLDLPCPVSMGEIASVGKIGVAS